MSAGIRRSALACVDGLGPNAPQEHLVTQPVNPPRAARTTALALAALLLPLLVGSVSPAQAVSSTRTTRTVSFKASAYTLTGPASLTLSGTAYKSPKGSSVVVERYSDGKWLAYRNLRTSSSSGAFGFTFTTARYGNTYYRARLPETSRLSAAKSVARKVSVYHAAQATLQASSDQVDAGDTVTLSGTVTPYQTGSAVTLQRLVSGVWTADGDPGTVSSTGDYSFTRQPPVGLSDYRVMTARTTTTFAAPAYSPSATVRAAGSGGLESGFDTDLVSRASDGTQGNYGSDAPAISADGRYIAYSSAASTLVSGDVGVHTDVFVTDRTTGQTTRVSTATDGTEADGGSHDPAISGDGRYITYDSDATNLVPGDTNSLTDVFVTDRTTGQTTRVSTTTDGTQGDASSLDPAISGDGRYITYETYASNLVSGDTNHYDDVLVADRTTGQTTRVSTATNGTQSNARSYDAEISGDGRYVAYYSEATTLVPGDTNKVGDVFVTDRTTGQTTRVSTATKGTQGNDGSYSPQINADGHYVTFYSDATNLVHGDTNAHADVFVTDRTTGQTTRVSTATDGTQGDADSYAPAISSDGCYVTYESGATTLELGDTNGAEDVFVTDCATGQTTRVSTATDGTQGNDSSIAPAISADGSAITYESYASTLVAGDTNDAGDIFVAAAR